MIVRHDSNFQRTKFVPCSVCSDPAITLKRFPGNYMNGKVAVKCECLKKYEWEEKYRLECYRAGVESEINFFMNLHQGDEDTISKLEAYVNNFSTYGKFSLYVRGDSGTGKTQIAKSMACNLIKNGYKVAYVKYNDLIKLLLDFETESITLKYINNKILIIDSVFDKSLVEKKLYDGIEYVNNIINVRIEDSIRNLEYKPVIMFGRESLSSLYTKDFISVTSKMEVLQNMNTIIELNTYQLSTDTIDFDSII